MSENYLTSWGGPEIHSLDLEPKKQYSEPISEPIKNFDIIPTRLDSQSSSSQNETLTTEKKIWDLKTLAIGALITVVIKVIF